MGLGIGDSKAPRVAGAKGSTATKKEETRSKKATGSGEVVGSKAHESSSTRDGGAPKGQGLRDVRAPRAPEQEATHESRKKARGAG